MISVSIWSPKHSQHQTATFVTPFELRICVGWDGADKKKMKTSFDLEPVRWSFEYGSVHRDRGYIVGMLSELSCFRDLKIISW